MSLCIRCRRHTSLSQTKESTLTRKAAAVGLNPLHYAAAFLLQQSCVVAAQFHIRGGQMNRTCLLVDGKCQPLHSAETPLFVCTGGNSIIFLPIFLAIVGSDANRIVILLPPASLSTFAPQAGLIVGKKLLRDCVV